jgi:GntR family transcriptional regulator
MTDVQPLAERRLPYDQVYRRLRGHIERGDLRPGDRLPAERTLAEELPVSRVTVRRALEQLERDGLIEDRRVASLGEAHNMLLSFSAIGAERGLVTTATVLVATVRAASLNESEALRIAPGAPIFELHRVRHLGGLPVAFDANKLAYDRVTGIEAVDFTAASLYATLEDRYGIVATRADYAIEAVGATRRDVELLDVEIGAAMLHASGTMYDQHDRPTDIGCMVYRGGRNRFRTTLARR